MTVILKNGLLSELRDFRLIKRKTAVVGGRKFTYCLFRVYSDSLGGYALVACEDGYSELCTVTVGKVQAERIFSAVVRGGVAPCSFKDVVRDMLLEI